MTPQVVCSNVTLTASFAAVNAEPVYIQGLWTENKEGSTVLLVRHVKHASQSGGYVVIRLVWGYYLADGTHVPCHDPLLDPNTTTSSGVTTVTINRPEAELMAIKDSDGARWLPVEVTVPTWASSLYYLEALQAGDTTNFGKIYAQLERL